jgi:hypothetical protein
MMKRRNFLKGLLAAPAVVAIPAIAAIPMEPVNQDIMGSLERACHMLNEQPLPNYYHWGPSIVEYPKVIEAQNEITELCRQTINQLYDNATLTT